MGSRAKADQAFRISLRQSIKPTEFRYAQGLSSQRAKSSRTITLPRHPDIQSRGDTAIHQKLAPRRSFPEVPPPSLSHSPMHQSIFNRFRYESYSNYQYESPQRTGRGFPGQDRVLRKEKVALGLAGDSKNLEIVYCETKFEDFVRKSNSMAQKMYASQTVAVGKEGRLKARAKSLSKINTKNKSKPEPCLKIIPSGQPKAILSQQIMQQFQRLKHLSQSYQQDHNLPQRYPSPSPHPLKLVLLQILTRQHPFLTHLPKQARDTIFKTLLNTPTLTPVTKLSCTEYSLFVRLFVDRSVGGRELAGFLFGFLCGGRGVGLRAARDMVGLLGGSANLHRVVQGGLDGVFEEAGGDAARVLKGIQGNVYLMRNIIELIVSTNQ